MRRIPGNSSTDGTTFQYLYSHSAWSSTPGYSPNQVAIYVPDAGHPAFGTVRAIVKDSNDNAWDMTYLDSDGQIESNANRSKSTHSVDVNDNLWHMITLSTLPEGGDGYVLYIDGSLAGEIKNTTQLPDGTEAVPTGGDPALMANEIFLCARSDLVTAGQEEARYYDGSLAHVMLFDAALSAYQIKDLYDTYNPDKYDVTSTDVVEYSDDYAAAKDAGMMESSTGDDGGGSSAGTVAGIVIAVFGGMIALAALAALAVSEMRRRRRTRGGPGGSSGAHGSRFERFQDNSGFDSGIYPRSPRSPDISFYPGTGNGANGGNTMMPRSDATLNIQMSSTPSGKLNGVPGGVLMKKESTPESPAEHAVSGSGLQHLHHHPPGSGGSNQGGGLKVNLSGSTGSGSGGFTRISAVSPGARVQATGNNPFNPPTLPSNSPGGSTRGVPASTIGTSLGGSPAGSVSGRSINGGAAVPDAMDDVDIGGGKKSGFVAGGSKYPMEPQSSMFTSLRQI